MYLTSSSFWNLFYICLWIPNYLNTLWTSFSSYWSAHRGVKRDSDTCLFYNYMRILLLAFCKFYFASKTELGLASRPSLNPIIVWTVCLQSPEWFWSFLTLWIHPHISELNVVKSSKFLCFKIVKKKKEPFSISVFFEVWDTYLNMSYVSFLDFHGL